MGGGGGIVTLALSVGRVEGNWADETLIYPVLLYVRVPHIQVRGKLWMFTLGYISKLMERNT